MRKLFTVLKNDRGDRFKIIGAICRGRIRVREMVGRRYFASVIT
jgi:hypothetical protein